MFNIDKAGSIDRHLDKAYMHIYALQTRLITVPTRKLLEGSSSI